MNFDLGDEQRMLKESGRKFFSREVDGTMVRRMEADEKGYGLEIWEKMAQLGWMGLLIPEAYDGAGMDLLDMALVLEEMGRAAFSGPFFTSSVVGTLILLEGGTEAQKREILPEIASGEKILTCGWKEENTATSCVGTVTRAVREDDHYEITGTKIFVPYAHVADLILIAAGTGEAGDDGDGGISLFIVDGNASGLSINGIDTSSGEKQCEVVMDRVRVPAENLVGDLNEGWRILAGVFQKSAVAKCAEMVGGSEKVLEMTVEYAKKREQFNRPIGSFQAIQHHCADMKTYLETSVLVTYRTCWLIGREKPWEKEAAMCKSMGRRLLQQTDCAGAPGNGRCGFHGGVGPPTVL